MYDLQSVSVVHKCCMPQGPPSANCDLSCKQSGFAVQRWWLIIPLVAVGGIAGYRWFKSLKGRRGGSSQGVEGSSDGHKGESATASPIKPAVAASSAHDRSTGQPQDPPAASSSSTGARQQQNSRDRHFINISKSFLSAASAFQDEE